LHPPISHTMGACYTRPRTLLLTMPAPAVYHHVHELPPMPHCLTWKLLLLKACSTASLIAGWSIAKARNVTVFAA
jgi:hypothetical protein